VACLNAKAILLTVQEGAGSAAGFTDEAYVQAGAHALPRCELYRSAELLVKIHPPAPARSSSTKPMRPAGADLHGIPQCLHAARGAPPLAGARPPFMRWSFVPASPRAEHDALSSMATVSGYKAVLARVGLPKMFRCS